MWKSRNLMMRGCLALVVILLWAYANPCLGQDNPCDYEKNDISFELSEQFRKANDYNCAKKVLEDLSNGTEITKSDQAEVHVRLGMINYRLFRNQNEKYDSTFTHFFRALQINPIYTGEIDRDQSEMGTIFHLAKDSLSRIESWRQQEIHDSLLNICDRFNDNKRVNTRFKIATGVLAAGTTAGILIFNGKANDSYDKYEASISPGDIQSAWDDYENNNRWRNIMIGAAVVSLAAEIFWFLKSPRKPDVDCKSLGNEINGGSLGLNINGMGIQLTLNIGVQ